MKKMKIASTAILCSAAALMSTVALAEGEFYGTIDFVRADIDLAGVLDDSDLVFGVGAGYRFNENFSVEAGYQEFGDISASGNGSVSLETEALQLSVIGGMPVSDNIGVYAEVGFDFWDAEAIYSNVPGFVSGTVSDDGADVYFGLGSYFTVVGTSVLKIEYQFHELEDVEIDTLSVGLSFTF